MRSATPQGGTGVMGSEELYGHHLPPGFAILASVTQDDASRGCVSGKRRAPAELQRLLEGAFGDAVVHDCLRRGPGPVGEPAGTADDDCTGLSLRRRLESHGSPAGPRVRRRAPPEDTADMGTSSHMRPCPPGCGSPGDAPPGALLFVGTELLRRGVRDRMDRCTSDGAQLTVTGSRQRSGGTLRATRKSDADREVLGHHS